MLLISLFLKSTLLSQKSDNTEQQDLTFCLLLEISKLVLTNFGMLKTNVRSECGYHVRFSRYKYGWDVSMIQSFYKIQFIRTSKLKTVEI